MHYFYSAVCFLYERLENTINSSNRKEGLQ